MAARGRRTTPSRRGGTHGPAPPTLTMGRMSPRRATPQVLESVLVTLASSLPDLAEQTCAQIYGELDSYAAIPADRLIAAVRRNLDTALKALREDRVPPPERLDGAAQTARERYDAGVPVEEIVRGFRISIALIHERFVDLAVTLGLPAAASVSGVRTLWRVADAFTTRIITEYHTLELDTAVRNAQRRVGSLRALLAGEAPDETLLALVDPATPYAAIRCEVPAADSAEAVRRRLEASGSAGAHRALVVVDGGQVLGVVAARPADPGHAVGIGPFVRLEELPRSDRIARQSLRVAIRTGRGGVLGLPELGWRLAAASRPDVWAHYATSFLTPLDAEGEFGAEVLAAVRSWLVHGRSIPRAAAELRVHVNTVRYRLGRYTDLTGADLDDPDDLLGITWAVELGHPDTEL